MFTEIQLENYARSLLWGVQKARVEPYTPGDVILVRYDYSARPLATQLHKLILQMGLNPVMRVNAPYEQEYDFYALGNDQQLTFVMESERVFFENLNGVLSLLGPESLTHLADIDPKKIGKAIVARKFLREIMEQREQESKLGWSLCLYPTEGLAKHAGISEDAYASQIVKACFLNEEDPVAHWENIYIQAGKIKDWLNSLPVDMLHVESAGSDLWVKVGEQRRWIGISGHNIPSFELFFSPDWRGTEGVYYADQPSFRSGNLVEGVRLTFEKGRVVDVQATEGESFVKEQLAMDPGAAQVGEFSLTDKRFSKIDSFMAHTLYDENYGGPQGNCHVAVGASYADTFSGDQTLLTKERKEALGFNDSALHWDLVNTEQRKVTARLTNGDELVIYKNGEFVYDDSSLAE